MNNRDKTSTKELNSTGKNYCLHPGMVIDGSDFDSSIDRSGWLDIEHFEVMVFKIVLFIIGMHDLYKYAQRFLDNLK